MAEVFDHLGQPFAASALRDRIRDAQNFAHSAETAAELTALCSRIARGPVWRSFGAKTDCHSALRRLAHCTS
jgi:hypothetical protein